MKSFSQFLQESYIEEELPAGMDRDTFNRLPAESKRKLTGSASAVGKKGQTLTGSASGPAIRSARKGMSGQQAATIGGVTAAGTAATLANTSGDNPAKPKLDDRLDSDIKTSKVKSPAKGIPTSRQVWAQFPGKPQKQYGLEKPPSSRVPYGNRTFSGTPSRLALPAKGETTRTVSGPLATRETNPQTPPESMMKGAYDAANKPTTTAKPSSAKTSATSKPRTTAYRNVGVGKENIKIPTSQPSTTGSSRREFTQKDVEQIRAERAAKKAARAAAYDAKQSSSASATKPSSALSTQAKPSSSAIVPAGKPPSGPKIKVPSGAGKALRFGGRLLGPAAAALDVADERAKGSGWLRSGLKAAVVGGAGALGAAAGAPLTPVGSLAAGTAASMAASKAFDVAAGANARERKAMATANRQRQAGTAVKGIGGQTTFSQKKPGGPAFMSTGVGKQRKTVELAKTGVVQRGGQSVAGHLAFKGGKAVYKAGPSAQSLAKTSSNPLERIGRSLFAGAYKKHDTMKAQQALQKARQSDTARNLKLGVKSKPAG